MPDNRRAAAHTTALVHDELVAGPHVDPGLRKHGNDHGTHGDDLHLWGQLFRGEGDVVTHELSDS